MKRYRFTFLGVEVARVGSVLAISLWGKWAFLKVGNSWAFENKARAFEKKGKYDLD